MGLTAGSRPKREPNKPTKQNTMKTMHLEIAEGLSVQVIPNPTFEFMLSTDDVAKGYGVASATIRHHKQNNQDELKEGIHFLSSVQKTNARSKSNSYTNNLETKQIFWTKAGIIRLGFFVKSQQAKMFRNWAEKLILKELSAQPDVKVSLPAPQFKANDNRELGLIFQNLMYRQLLNVENHRTRKRMAALLDFYVSQID